MNKIHIAVLAILASLGSSAWAQQTAQPASNQVIVPEVERREMKIPKFPSKDFAVGIYLGTYATENFGAAAVIGARAAYHISEDWFVEATLGQSKVSDEAFRQVLPGGIFASAEETLSYYNFSAGYNILPGEVFIGANRAKASALYLIAGIGSTKFNEQRSQTVNFGLGGRLLLSERSALQFDMRDHVFSLDLLGKRQSTHNLELTAGFSYYF